MTDETPLVHTVVKVGGGLLGTAGAFQLVIEALTAFRRGRRLAVLPGGGPFAEAVRQMFKRIKIGEDAAHWMAVLGMDQYAHALAARLPDAALVDGDGGIAAALQANRLPVLAPYRWLRAADPLPHSWEVTSDSIAAWLAGQLRARRVVLLKPAHAGAKKLVDGYFLRTLPHGVEHLIVTADDLGQLDVALREDPPPGEHTRGRLGGRGGRGRRRAG
ncbi:MAG: uridylate kinase [Gemmatimonadetes bacterium]|nr:MAG: uridylate kinase [Gemmatimonadota bacterium]